MEKILPWTELGGIKNKNQLNIFLVVTGESCPGRRENKSTSGWVVEGWTQAACSTEMGRGFLYSEWLQQVECREARELGREGELEETPFSTCSFKNSKAQCFHVVGSCPNAGACGILKR